MLRNTLIVLGLLVALDPYLGFPASLDRFILTGLGLTIFFLLIFSRRPRTHKEVEETVEEGPRMLHVERTEVEDSPRMHIERETIEDTESVTAATGEETVVEKKTTVVRRKKRKPTDELASPD